MAHAPRRNPDGDPRRENRKDGSLRLMRLALIELSRPPPLVVGCACWAEVASCHENEIIRRADIAAAALPAIARPQPQPVPVVISAFKIEWRLPDQPADDGEADQAPPPQAEPRSP